MKNDNNNIPIKDNFPDEYIFAVSSKNPWFTDISNYLAIGNFTPTIIS